MSAGALGLIAARGLTLERDGRTVFSRVDFDAPAGEVTAVLGPSGTGKTSLLRCLVRFEEPAEGRVLLDGADVRSLDAIVLRRAVGLVAQSPAMLPGSVRENLAYGLEGPSDAELGMALSAAALDPGFLDRDARRLSGGESARVAVARALTRGPRALLLDPAAVAVVERLIRDLAERGLAVVLVSHDAALVDRVADRGARLEPAP
jgi:ABC-type multidrug transport system fused ATPase/permease subunit